MMDRHFELIPEDGAICALLLAIGFRKPNKADGISDALNKMETHFKNRFAIGIVDDDKRKPTLFDSYSKVLKAQDALLLLQKPASAHFLIVVQPAIEKWLLQNAYITDVIASKYGFDILDDLKRVTKNEVEVVKNQRFKQFLNDLHPASALGFVTLGDWIEVLYEKYF
jgi:hypothetical protein